MDFFQKPEHMRAAIQTFTDHGLTSLAADFTSVKINTPRNALNLQSDIHFAMDKRLVWGIGALKHNSWMRK